jgi:hypothetical protein
MRKIYPDSPSAGSEKKSSRLAYPLILLTLLFAGSMDFAHAGDIYLVCSPNVTLTLSDARDVFLGEKQFAGSVKLQPADNSAAQANFLLKVMKMDAAKYTTAWTKKSFRDGSLPPAAKGTDAEVIEYLKHTAGGCGYLNSAPPAGLTLVGKL